MKKLWTLNFIIIMVVNFVTAMAFGGLVSTLPLYVRQIGSNNALAGSMTAGMTIAIILMNPISGYLGDRYGRRPVLIFGGIVFFLNTFAYLFATTIPILFIVRVLHGIGTSLFTVSAHTLVAEIVPEDRLVDGIGIYTVSGSLSTAVAPLTANYIAGNFGFPALFVVLSISAALGVVFSSVIKNITAAKPVLPGKNQLAPVRRGIGFEASVLLPSVVILFAFMCNSAGNNFIPVYGIEKGIANISVFFLVNGICMMLSRLFAGKLSARYGYTKTVISGLLLIFSSYLLIGVARSIFPIIVAALLNGFGTGIATPIINSHIYTLCDPSRKGLAQATYGIFTFCGTGFGAMLWGFISEAAGLSVTFYLASLTAVVAMLIYFLLLRPKLRAKSLAVQVE